MDFSKYQFGRLPGSHFISYVIKSDERVERL